jgi:hypothetical protein
LQRLRRVPKKLDPVRKSCLSASVVKSVALPSCTESTPLFILVPEMYLNAVTPSFASDMVHCLVVNENFVNDNVSVLGAPGQTKRRRSDKTNMGSKK